MVERSGTDTVHEVDFAKLEQRYLAAKNTLIPAHLQGGLERYLQEGILPGGFLQAVLENKLKESFERADDISRKALPDIVHYLYNYIPMAAWGSPEHVAEWCKQRRYGTMRALAQPYGASDAQLKELQEGL